MIDLSIIIVNYKTPELTLSCIKSIYEHTLNINFEIILIDNDSSDGIEDLLKSKFPKVLFRNTGYNSGFSRANNMGAELASGKYIVLLNSDTQLIDNVFGQCLKRMEDNQNISAVGVTMLDAEKNTSFVDPNFNLLGNIQYSFVTPYNFLVKKISNYYTKRLKKKLVNKYPDYILGAFFLCRLEDFKKAGKMDNNLFLYAEDLDLSCKMAQKGDLKLFDDLSIIHLEGGSTHKNEVPATFFSRSPQMQLSNLYFIRKWYGVTPFLLIMLSYWAFIPFYFLIRIMKGLLNGWKKEFEAPVQFTKQVTRWSAFFFSILLLKDNFYKY